MSKNKSSRRRTSNNVSSHLRRETMRWKDKEEYRGSDGKREKEKKRVGESERKKSR